MKKFLLPILLAFMLLGCAKDGQIPTTYTMEISPQTLQNNIAEQFPIEKELSVGKIKLLSPKIGLKEGSDRMQTAISFSYKPPFFSAQKGTIDLSGKIKYNQKSSAFFLQEPMVHEIKFNNTSLSGALLNKITAVNKKVMQQIINGVFQQFPIHRLTPQTLSGKFLQKTVKKAEVKNGKLLITFGL